MARDYWVEASPSGQRRFIKTTTTTHTHRPHLRRSHTHDGSQSSRSRRVDFVDVTRKEYDALLARERSLLVTNEELSRENWALKANYQTCNDELQRLQSLVPGLETTVRNLEYENMRLKSGQDNTGGYYYHHQHYHGGVGDGRDRDREDELRKLRHKNTRLWNENDSLLAKLKSLERGVRGGLRDGARRIGEDLSHWKHKVTKLEDENERLNHKLNSVLQRCKRLEVANDSLAREERKWRREVDTYEAYLRRHGFSVR